MALPRPIFALSKTSKSFCGLFGLLAVISLAHDIYIWKVGGNFFSLGDTGAILRRYWPEGFTAIEEFFGPDLFAAILNPIFVIPATLLFLGLAAFSFVSGFVSLNLRAILSKDQHKTIKELRKESKASGKTMSLKDQVKLRIR